jgi:hypothetical protein
MPLPQLTHLQFAVIESLLNGDRAGHEIRDHLAKRGVNKSGPAFYQMMARLEDTKFVEGHYDERVIDGQMIRERRYKLLRNGEKAYSQTADFYRDAIFAKAKGVPGYAH